MDALPDGIGQLVVIDGAGHFTWLDAPQSHWPVITGFTDSLPQPVNPGPAPD